MKRANCMPCAARQVDRVSARSPARIAVRAHRCDDQCAEPDEHELSDESGPAWLRNDAPGPTGKALSVDNPFAVEAIAPLLEGLNTVWPVALVALLVSAIGSVILGFRRARGDERQQLTWFAYVSGFVPVAIASSIALRPLPEDVRVPIQAAILWHGDGALSGRRGHRRPPLSPIRHRSPHQLHARVRGNERGLIVTYAVSVILLGSALRPLTGSGRSHRGGALAAARRAAAPAAPAPPTEAHRRVLPRPVLCPRAGGAHAPAGTRLQRAQTRGRLPGMAGGGPSRGP